MLGHVLALLTAAAAATAAVDLSLTPFTFDLSPVDPVIAYAPIGPRTPDTVGGTDSANAPTGAASVTSDGWEITYSGTNIPAANVTFVTIGSGTPKRSTSTAGATATISWVGTGMWFLGDATDLSGIDIRVDGFPTNPNGTNGVLGGIQNIAYKQHTAVLKVNSGTVNLLGVTLMTALQTQGIPAASVNITTVSTVAGSDKTLNPAIDWTSTDYTAWAGRWDWAGTAWDHAGTTGQGSTLAYKVPANTSFLAIYGGTAAVNGDYAIGFSPALSDMSTGTKGSEYSTWRGQDLVLWAGPIDPTTEYKVTLTTLLGKWWTDVSMIKTWSALDHSPASSTSSSAPAASSTEPGSTTADSNVGAIAGGVVGGVVAVAAVLALIWFLRRRRRRHRTSPLDILDNDSDHRVEHKPHDADLFPAQNRNSNQWPNQYPEPSNPKFQTNNSNMLNDEDHTLLTPFPAGTSSPTATSSVSGFGSGATSPLAYAHPSKQALANPPRPREITQQEQDGGAVVVNLVPPSYDPAWAGGSAGASSGDNANSGR